MEIPNIVRTIKLDRKVTGQELSDALLKFAEGNGEARYAETLISDRAGQRTVLMGLQGRNLLPYYCVEVRTGEGLAKNEINLHSSYSTIGIGTSTRFSPAEMPNVPQGGHRASYLLPIAEGVIEEIRDGLEEILTSH